MKKKAKQFKFKALYTSLRFYVVVPLFLIIFLLTGLKGFGQSPIPDIKEVAVWSNSPVKVGEALAFHATGGTVYSWTGPNNFTSNEQFNQINPADTLNSGTYTVDIYDAEKDTTYTRTLNVTVDEPASLGLIIVEDNYICINSTLHLNGIVGWDTYYWSGPGLSSTAQNVSIPITNLNQGGPYTLTVTQINPFKTETETIQINVIDCCAGGEANLIRNGTLPNPVNPPTESTLVIWGNLLLNQSYDFPNITEIILLGDPSLCGPSSIIAYPGSDVTMIDKRIHGCKFMWNLIQFNEPASALVDFSTIYDGMRGFENISMNGNLSIAYTNNIFENNSNCINVFHTPFSYLFTNNSFHTGTSGLLYPNLGQKGYCGMIFDKATITLPDDTVTGDINTFNNLRNGIIAYDCSSFEIGKQTTKFSNIIGNSIMNSQSTLVDGCGIFAGSHDGTPCLGTFIKRGNESLTIPDFDNCSHAIYSRGYKTKLLSNRINNVHTGIQIEKAMDLETDIHDNIINCSQKGIFLYQNSPNVFSISNNFIHLINNANNSSQVSACIEVSEFVNSSQSTNGNIIFANKVYAENYANFGILCNTTKGTKIFENEAYLTDATYNKAGIKTELGENLVINCNQIYGPGASLGGSIYPTGIEAQTSPNSEYSCNYMTDTYTGFYLDGGCYQSDIRGNTFGSHSIGLHYGADGNSGYQYDKGNIWLTQCSLYGAKHDNQGTYWMYSRYTANQYTQYWPNGTTLFDPPGWFLNSSNTPFSCEDLDPPCSDKDGMRTYSPAIDTLVSAYDTATAQMQLPANIFNDEITWSASKTLYQKLREQPELLSGNQVMGSFIDSIQYESPASYQEIDDLGQSVLQMPEALSATFNNLLEQRSVLVDSIQLIDSLLSLLPSYSDSLDMIALKTNILTNLKMINNQIVSVQNAHAQIRNNSATELLAGNSALNVENDITANTKLLNEIYFSTFGKGIYTFTDTQLQLLKTIAIQCPVSGGPSVYGARSLLSGCYDTTYDDSDICLQAGILKSLQNPVMVNEQIQYNFYPNPASENLTITWNIPLDEQAELNLYNTTGQRIFTQRILLKNTAVNIDISGMSSGIYSIELVRQSVVRKMGKLVCISSK